MTDRVESSLAGLIPALHRLDGLLARAAAVARDAYGAGSAADPYRGLHISPEEVGRLLARAPGVPMLWGAEDVPATDNARGSRLATLATVFGLDAFDLDVLVVALAPELDLRYERLYAFLHDDVTRRRPSVDLALELLCQSTEAKLVRRARFAPDAPLVRSALLTLTPDPQRPRSPLLAHEIAVDEPVVSWLLGREGLDPQLAPWLRSMEPRTPLDRIVMSDERRAALPTLMASSHGRGFYFHGRPGTGRRSVAAALAAACSSRLLSTDIRTMLRPGDDFVGLCRRVAREAALHQAGLFIEGVEALSADDHPREIQCLRELVADARAWIVLAGTDPDWPVRCEMPALVDVPFAVPDHAERRRLWAMGLDGVAAVVADRDLEWLSRRFRLTPGQIAVACELARTQAASSPGSPAVTLDQLTRAARRQTGHALARLARKLTPRYGWADIVLPDDHRAQLREICLQFAHRATVHGEWGFGMKMSRGKGLHVLFSGPPGTGKTMAAEVIAAELGLDLYTIDLSQVVSKYIGETEKNLDRIFAAAEDANAILFFDEADALFGKRSEIRDAHDRYANIEVGYLLQKMEEHEGIAILATNLKSHLDPAFLRRLQIVVEFPLPDEIQRRRIWEGVFPGTTPLGDDVDFGLLAREVRLPGGNIATIGLTAAFYAADDGGKVHMPHVWRAVRREYQKLGVLSSGAQLPRP